MKLCDLEVGGIFKLAKRNSKRNRMYVKTKYDYENNILCHIYGRCHQFLFSPDTEIVVYNEKEALIDLLNKVRVMNLHE